MCAGRNQRDACRTRLTLQAVLEWQRYMADELLPTGRQPPIALTPCQASRLFTDTLPFTLPP